LGFVFSVWFFVCGVFGLRYSLFFRKPLVIWEVFIGYASACSVLERMLMDGDYCRAIGETGDQYDVVIVDSRDRMNCLKQSISALTSRGVILLDDSQRRRY
jgi:hypothetical protein